MVELTLLSINSFFFNYFFIKTEVFKFKFKAPSSPTHQCVACEEPGDGQKCQQKFHIDKVLTEPPLHTRVARRRNFLTFFFLLFRTLLTTLCC